MVSHLLNYHKFADRSIHNIQERKNLKMNALSSYFPCLLFVSCLCRAHLYRFIEAISIYGARVRNLTTGGYLYWLLLCSHPTDGAWSRSSQTFFAWIESLFYKLDRFRVVMKIVYNNESVLCVPTLIYKAKYSNHPILLWYLTVYQGPYTVGFTHRYLKKSRLTKFVMCPLLALPLPRVFLQQPLTVLARQTMQSLMSLISLSFLDICSCATLKKEATATQHHWKSMIICT